MDKTPERTCVGCQKRQPAEVLVRVVLVEASSSVVPDAKGGSFGRGAHVHPSPSCLESAAKKGFARSFKREIKVSPTQLAIDIVAAFERRLAGLLSGGVRAGLVAIGTDAVIDALRAGKGKLVVLAGDAAAAAQREEVRRATGEGKSVVFGNRMRLAEAVGRTSAQAREGVAVVAITDDGLAAEVKKAWLCVEGLGEAADGGRCSRPTAGRNAG